MVFIHGGAYILGSSATPIYDGAALARRGCVYVSVNYRLGALGCLDLSSLSAPRAPPSRSNLFLRDLVMALQWVRDNVAVFGGDPDNVTIFGESAGAQAVATLLAVPAAKGLFRQAISESPAAGLTRSQDVAARFAERFAALVGARRSDAAHALMAAPPAELVNALDALIDATSVDMLGAFPVGPSFGDDVLPVDPVEAMRTGRAHPVPLIVGNNADEARLFTRFLKLLPTTEHNDRGAAGRGGRRHPRPHHRGLPRLPGTQGLPAPRAATSRSASAAWQIADAHSATPRPTSTATTTHRGRCTGRGSAPRTPPSCSRCSTVYRPGSAPC